MPRHKEIPWVFAFEVVIRMYSRHAEKFWKIKRKASLPESFSPTLIKRRSFTVLPFREYLADYFCCSWRDINKYILYVDKTSITTKFLTVKFNKSDGTNFLWPTVINMQISSANKFISAYNSGNWTIVSASTLCCSSLMWSLFLLISFYDIHNDKEI